MSGKVKAIFRQGPNFLGKRDHAGGAEATLLLQGAGIATKHCRIDYDCNSRLSVIYPNEDDP